MCKKCNKRGLYLEHTSQAKFAVTLEIIYNYCDVQIKGSDNEIIYLTKNTNEVKIRNKTDVKEQKKYKQLICKKTIDLTTIIKARDWRKVHPVSRTYNSICPATTFLDLNIRALLSVYYLRTGNFDVDGFANFFGFSGGRLWERISH